jgi:hypothetical protein
MASNPGNDVKSLMIITSSRTRAPGKPSRNEARLPGVGDQESISARGTPAIASARDFLFLSMSDPGWPGRGSPKTAPASPPGWDRVPPMRPPPLRMFSAAAIRRYRGCDEGCSEFCGNEADKFFKWKGPFQSLQLGHVEPGQPGPRRHALSAVCNVRDRAVAKTRQHDQRVAAVGKARHWFGDIPRGVVPVFFGVIQNDVTPALRNVENVSGCGRHERDPSAGNSTGGAIRYR